MGFSREEIQQSLYEASAVGGKLLGYFGDSWEGDEKQVVHHHEQIIPNGDSHDKITGTISLVSNTKSFGTPNKAKIPQRCLF